MKKTAIMLALFLFLTGCGPAAPVVLPTAPDEPDHSSQSMTETSMPDSSAIDSDSAPQSTVDAPMPVAPPPTVVGAIDLPEQLATSDVGYTVELLTPAQYDLYFPLNRGGFRGFQTCDFFPLGQGGKLAIANKNGTVLTEPIYYSNLEGWNSLDGFIPIRTEDNADGATGALDVNQGTILIPLHYDHVWRAGGDEHGGLIEVQKGDTFEILDRKGNSHYTLERGDQFYTLGKRNILLKDGMLRIYTKEYSPVQNFACDELKIVSSSLNGSDRNLLAVESNGVWALCDTDGKFLTNPIYDEIGSFVNGHAEFTKNGKKGVLNEKGKEVVRGEWEDLCVYSKSVSVCKDGRWGAITDIDAGKIGIEPVYDYVYGVGDYNYACYERHGKYGIIDRDGNEIMTARYDSPIMTENANLDKGYYLITGSDGPYAGGIVEGDGRVDIPSDHSILTGHDGEKYNLIVTPSGKWGYSDDRGRFVIDAQFENADAFIKGKNIAFVQKDGKINLIDRKGNTVLKTVFSDLIGYNPETMVCAMEYTNEKGVVKGCLVKIEIPAPAK